MTTRASCGLSFKCPADLPSAVLVTTQASYDFMCIPIVHPRYRLPDKPGTPADPDEKYPVRNYSHTRSDFVLPSNEWAALIVGLISRDLNLESKHPDIRRNACDKLSWELNFANHLGLSAIMLPLTKPNNANLSRILKSFVCRAAGPQVWIRAPISSPISDTWSWWNQLRFEADFEKRIYVALELNKDSKPDEVRLKRWLGEPVKALILSTSLFVVNKRGFPVLPKVIQEVINLFIDLKIQFIIEGRNGDINMNAYQKYLDFLIDQHTPVDPVRQHAQGFEDFLQSPLQPLMDNLESCTYEVFEKDPIKYMEYGRAIQRALTDLVPIEEAKTKTLVLMVLGAGRGPIVQAALDAAEAVGRKVKLYAVEKNPYAVVTLLTLKEEKWGDSVDVISSDMREWKPTQDQLADIIISELLGSFGDNELSPECLYSAQHLMKPDGISIPSSYTSWVGPLQSSKLYQEVRSSADSEKNPEAHFETPYVVHLQNRFEIAKPQPLFTFEHPLKGPIDNTRYEIRTFQIAQDCVLNGFAGYFECTLYKDVMISTNPATFSKNMISWFPIFFPLRSPTQLNKGSELELHFWRLNNTKQVWYEWCITKPVPIHVHNPSGRSYTIGL